MTPTTQDEHLLRDERAFADAVDAVSPALLGLARRFADDDDVAEQMVVSAWLGALPEPAAGDVPLRVALVRRMAADAAGDSRALTTARRALLLALRATGVLLAPEQRRPGAAPRTVPRAQAALQEQLSSLPPELHLVLVLHDVHGWPAEELIELLGVQSTAWRRLLGHARDALCQLPGAPPA